MWSAGAESLHEGTEGVEGAGDAGERVDASDDVVSHDACGPFAELFLEPLDAQGLVGIEDAEPEAQHEEHGELVPLGEARIESRQAHHDDAEEEHADELVPAVFVEVVARLFAGVVGALSIGTHAAHVVLGSGDDEVPHDDTEDEDHQRHVARGAGVDHGQLDEEEGKERCREAGPPSLFEPELFGDVPDEADGGEEVGELQPVLRRTVGVCVHDVSCVEGSAYQQTVGTVS